MILEPIDTVLSISCEDFNSKYLVPNRPVIIKDLAKKWPAYEKWTFEYIKSKVGGHDVAVYNNEKSDPYTPVNKPDGVMKFGSYLDKIKSDPAGLRIFLFNILSRAPELIQDFLYPEELTGGFLKKYPMLFTGGAGSVTHMHFDMDLSHIFHTQFLGSKRVLLFKPDQRNRLYHLPFTVQSLVNFEKYYNGLDEAHFPALKYLSGYELVLDHGDTLFMPGGYWHHMEYIESGLALSLRAMESITTKMQGIVNLVGMRHIDTLMKKTVPDVWYNYKKRKALINAAQELVEA
ncbi:MAG: cupin-like domain-containing protein [Chitinophagales bacterium]|nr:cupin-like domain-containing protein [Chitinophagales bacterium]